MYVRSMGFGLGRLGARVILRLRACEQRQTNGIPNGIQYGLTSSLEIAMHCIRSACRTGCRWLHIATDRPTEGSNVMLNRDQGRSVMRAYWRARVRTYRQARVTSRVHAFMHTCKAHGQKLKSSAETTERSTPRRDFKSFRSSGRQREMGILSTPSAHPTIFANFAA